MVDHVIGANILRLKAAKDEPLAEAQISDMRTLEYGDVRTEFVLPLNHPTRAVDMLTCVLCSVA